MHTVREIFPLTIGIVGVALAIGGVVSVVTDRPHFGLAVSGTLICLLSMALPWFLI